MNCEICSRDGIDLEKHHLNPNRRKGKTIKVCIHCGDQIHQLFTNKELRDKYNTLGSLLANEKIQSWIKWVRKKNPSHVCMKKKVKKS